MERLRRRERSRGCLAYVLMATWAHSLLLDGSGLFGIVNPGLLPWDMNPIAQIVADAREIAEETGAEIHVLTDPRSGGRSGCGLHRRVDEHGAGEGRG